MAKKTRRTKRTKQSRNTGGTLLQNTVVQSIALALIILFLAISLFETQSGTSPTLGGIGSVIGNLFNYLLGGSAWLLLGWLSVFAFYRTKSTSSTLTLKTPFLILLLSIAGLFGSSFNGGLIGESIELLLESAIGTWASKVLLFAIALLSVAKLKGYSNQQLTNVFTRLTTKREPTDQVKGEEPDEPKVGEAMLPGKPEGSGSKNEITQDNKEIPALESTDKTVTEEGSQADYQEPDRFSPRPMPTDYNIPDLNILNPVIVDSGPSNEELQQTADDLRKALTAFDVKSKVVDWKVGPMATTYHIELSIGERVKNIESRINDIERAMGQDEDCIRLAGNIAGLKNTVGVEIPNKQRRTCVIKEALNDDSFSNSDQTLPIALGIGIDGINVCEDLTEFPHLMVAGSTGSGKSVALNGIIFSLLYKKPPSELRLVLIDPKAVEFSPYKNIPHLLTDVVTEMEEAVEVLEKLCEEMDERYDLLEQKAVRNIGEYHDLMGNTESMPYIVILIDELADLMMTQGRQVEDLVGRLSQKARAAGMHLVLATQRPTSDVIKGLIKTNVPARLAFRVANNVDSRVIIQDKGAETLMGLGDCLFRTPRRSGLDRIQSPLVTGEEVRSLVDHIRT